MINATEILENNHQLVLQSVDDLPESEWEVPGVCGDWSVKDVIAHLAAYELLLLDIFDTFSGTAPTPYMLRFAASIEEFNTAASEARKYRTAQQVLDEYQDAQVRTTSLLAQIPVEKVQEKGTLAWYKADRSLAEQIERFAQHARSHCEEIKQFREKARANS